jgi:hypothetical protein
MPPRRSDRLRQLQRLLQLEGAAEEVRAFVHEHVAELAPLLGGREDQLLEAAQEEDFARRLRRHLAGLRQCEREQRDADAGVIASKVATTLGGSARWREEEAHLDVRPLLDPELTAAAVDLVIFNEANFNVAISKKTLVGLRRHLPRFPDLLAYVDLGGLHLRWRAGRGHLNFHPQPMPKTAPMLVVPLAPRQVVLPVVHQKRTNHLAEAVFAAIGFNM